MPEATINTKTLPQLPLAAVLDELFENGADMMTVETCFNELLVSCDHIRPDGEPWSPPSLLDESKRCSPYKDKTETTPRSASSNHPPAVCFTSPAIREFDDQSRTWCAGRHFFLVLS